MIINANKDSLVEALSVIERGLSSRSVIPAAQGVLVEAVVDALILTTNNLEMGIRGRLYDVEVLESGALVLPGKFIEALKQLPNQKVRIQTVSRDETTVVEVISGKSKFTFYPMPAEEFPLWTPENITEEWDSIELNAKDIKEMVEMVSFAASKDQNKPLFNNILLTAEEDGHLICVASDTYRISRYEKRVEGLKTFNAMLIPNKNMVELARILDSSDEPVICRHSYNEIVFEYKSYIFSSGLVDGKFPDINRVFPRSSLTSIVVAKDALESVLARANVVALPGKPRAAFDISDNKLVVTVQESAGEFDESVKVEQDGEDLDGVVFNIRYLMEPIKIIDSDLLRIEFNGIKGPCVIRWQGDGMNYHYLVLPIEII